MLLFVSGLLLGAVIAYLVDSHVQNGWEKSALMSEAYEPSQYASMDKALEYVPPTADDYLNTRGDD